MTSAINATKAGRTSASERSAGTEVQRHWPASPDAPTAQSQHTEAELKLIQDMRRRNPTLGMLELWHRLRQRGYTRRSESLFRAMRKMSLFPAEKPKPAYKPKPYEQMTHPGERVQVDVKVVPRRCITDPEHTRVVREPIGRYHEPLAAALHEHDIYVCVLNPLFIKQSGSSSIRKVKTDKADAMKIAKLRSFHHAAEE